MHVPGAKETGDYFDFIESTSDSNTSSLSEPQAKDSFSTLVPLRRNTKTELIPSANSTHGIDHSLNRPSTVYSSPSSTRIERNLSTENEKETNLAFLGNRPRRNSEALASSTRIAVKTHQPAAEYHAPSKTNARPIQRTHSNVDPNSPK